MKENELRIGNYVTIDNNENWEEIKHIPMVVISIKYKEEGNYSISVDMAFEEDLFYNGFSQYERFIEPIPLTEEWLVKFGMKLYDGFSEKRVIYIEKHKYDTSLITYSQKEGIVRFSNGEQKGSTLIPHIKHVHQLQNLYHSLTGKELTIKENEKS